MDESRAGKLQWFSMRGDQPQQERSFNQALRFIRTRASVRRIAANNRSKSAEKGAACHQASNSAKPGSASTPNSSEQPTTSSGNNSSSSSSSSSGFGRWLREHLTVSKSSDSNGGKLKQQSSPSQNLYCSLPRERAAGRRPEQRRASCRIVASGNEQRQVQKKLQPELEIGKEQHDEQRTQTIGRRRARAKAERRRHSMSEFQSGARRNRSAGAALDG